MFSCLCVSALAKRGTSCLAERELRSDLLTWEPYSCLKRKCWTSEGHTHRSSEAATFILILPQFFGHINNFCDHDWATWVLSWAQACKDSGNQVMMINSMPALITAASYRSKGRTAPRLISVPTDIVDLSGHTFKFNHVPSTTIVNSLEPSSMVTSLQRGYYSRRWNNVKHVRSAQRPSLWACLCRFW